MAKRYFLKFNVVSEGIVLDASSETSSVDEILLSKSTVSLAQGKLLRDAIKKYDNPYSTEVMHEFDKLFVVCLGCELLMTRSKMKKAQGNRCISCWKQNVEDKKVVYFKNVNRQKDYERQMRKMKLHLKSPQGKCDAVRMDIIESNVRIALAKSGGTWKEMAESIGVSTSVIYSLFERKYIRVERLLQICNYLKTPLSTILEIPYGVKIKKLEGVPIHMIEGTIPYLHESISRNL